MILSQITDLNEDSLETYGALTSVLVVLLIFFGPFFAYYLYSVWRVRRWENSILHRKGDRNAHNFGLAYVVLIGMLLKQDPREYAAKSSFIKKSLQEISANTIDLDNILQKIHQRDVRVKHVAHWANLRLSEVEREELMYALIEIVYMDETLIRKEMSLLLDFVKYTHISKRDLESMMASHKQRLAREAEEERREEQKKRRESTLAYRREKAFQILGVSPFASHDEIKKAYRELVKKHHPDLFYGKDASLREAAESRFIEIQKAYDLITSNIS